MSSIPIVIIPDDSLNDSLHISSVPVRGGLRLTVVILSSPESTNDTQRQRVRTQRTVAQRSR